MTEQNQHENFLDEVLDDWQDHLGGVEMEVVVALQLPVGGQLG
jgi:hypothetical protein